MEYTAAGNIPYTTIQIVTTAYQLVFSTRVFGTNCKKWRKNPDAERIWPNFIIFFTEKYMDWREEQQQEFVQGYQYQVNSATYQQDTINAIA